MQTLLVVANTSSILRGEKEWVGGLTCCAWLRGYLWSGQWNIQPVRMAIKRWLGLILAQSSRSSRTAGKPSAGSRKSFSQPPAQPQELQPAFSPAARLHPNRLIVARCELSHSLEVKGNDVHMTPNSDKPFVCLSSCLTVRR